MKTQKEEDVANLVAMARHKVGQARKKDRRAIEYVLKQANVYLKNIVKGDTYRDQERIVYLEFLTECMDKVETVFENIDPKKKETDIGKDLKQAFQLDASRRPLTKDYARDFIFFVETGREYDKFDKPVDEAVKIAARKKKVSPSLVRKGWDACGGLDTWIKVRHLFPQEKKALSNSKEN